MPEFLLCLLQLGTSLHTLHLQQTLFYQLGSTCLHSKVGLCEGNLRFARISILRHEVAGITSEQDVINITLRSFSCNYHLPDVRKMIGNILPHILTGFFCLVNYIREIFPFAIAEQFL